MAALRDDGAVAQSRHSVGRECALAGQHRRQAI